MPRLTTTLPAAMAAIALLATSAWAQDATTETVAIEAAGPAVVSLDGVARTRSGATLATGTTIAWGDSVVVAAGSKVQISDGAEFGIIAWGPAEVEIKQTSKKTTWLDLVYGRVIAAFRDGTRAAMSTRSSVAGVRGTVIYQEDTADIIEYTCVCEGTVGHKHRKAKGESRTSENYVHHELPIRATPDGYVDDTMQNHNDDDVAAAKALIGK